MRRGSSSMRRTSSAKAVYDNRREAEKLLDAMTDITWNTLYASTR